MRCADEGLEDQIFEPANKEATDWYCTSCGWYQRSTAGGCAELCEQAAWFDQKDYEEYRDIAIEGGYSVPETPKHLWNKETEG
jgi:hypothetical protein